MKPIKTAREHEAAIVRISELMEISPQEGSELRDELEVLAILVEAYEKTKHPRELPDPIEAIKFRADQLGLTAQDLEPIFGSRSKVSEVLSRKRPLSIAMIRRANKILGISTDVLLNAPEDVAADAVDEITPLAVVEMWRRGYFPRESAATIGKIKENARQLLTQLFSVFSSDGPRPIFCRRGDAIPARGLLTAWQARCTTLASEIEAPPFRKNALTQKLPREVAKLSFYDDGPKLAIDLLKMRGIKVVMLKHLSKTKLDGASFLSPTGHPIVGLTLRYDRADNFWFTLLHELGHVYNDLHDASEAFFDSKEETLNSATEDPRERSANDFAAAALIPADRWIERRRDLLANPNTDMVNQFASEIEVNPAIIAGRIRWEKNNYTILADVTSSAKVRHHFPQV